MTTAQLEAIARAELVTLQHEPLVLAACVRAMERAVAELERQNEVLREAILNWQRVYRDTPCEQDDCESAYKKGEAALK